MCAAGLLPMMLQHAHPRRLAPLVVDRRLHLLLVLDQHFRTNAYIDGFVFSERDEAFIKVMFWLCQRIVCVQKVNIRKPLRRLRFLVLLTYTFVTYKACAVPKKEEFPNAYRWCV